MLVNWPHVFITNYLVNESYRNFAYHNTIYLSCTVQNYRWLCWLEWMLCVHGKEILQDFYLDVNIVMSTRKQFFITRCIITWYYTWHGHDICWIQIRFWTHKRHSLPRTILQDMECLLWVYFGENDIARFFPLPMGDTVFWVFSRKCLCHIDIYLFPYAESWVT